MRNLDLNIERKRIVDFIRSYLKSSGFTKVVFGLSGGLDSAVAGALAVEALGPQNVIAAILPYKITASNSLEHAELMVKSFGMQSYNIDLTPMTEPYFELYEPQADRSRKGNWLARLRMNVLFDLSAKHRALVMGTGNRSEIMVGYFTLFGDAACAFEPIAHLYKTEVAKLAELLEIPSQIIKKAPSADLWEGQSDEKDLGFSYPVLDEILDFLEHNTLESASDENLKFPRSMYEKVDKMVSATAFKRALPPSLEMK